MEYELIFRRFLGKFDDPKFLSYDTSTMYEFMTEYLHSTLAIPYISKLFVSKLLDDKIQVFSYVLKNPLDDESDKEFLIDILSSGMILQWMKPQIDNKLALAKVIGGKEEKVLQNDYKSNHDRYKYLWIELRKEIRDSGYVNNSYLNEGV